MYAVSANISSMLPTTPTRTSPASGPDEVCPPNTTGPPPLPLRTKATTKHPFDEVCLVLDLEYFCSGRQILPRELGYCDHTGNHHGSIHYKPCVEWPHLSVKDRRTAYYVSKYVHGLPYYPRENYHMASELLVDVRHLYQQFKTPQRTLVAHKGGMEGDWLETWNIPHLDLEHWGCPKFDNLPHLSSVGSCAQHQHPLQLHCPQVECYHFVQWMRSQRLLSYDTRYINHERTQRMLASQTPRIPLRPALKTLPPPKFRFLKEHRCNNKD